MLRNDNSSHLGFYFGKNSKNRTRHIIPKPNAPEDVNHMEFMTFNVNQDSETEDLKKRINSDSETDKGRYLLMPNINDVMIAQQILIERHVPNYYVRVNEGWYPNTDDKELVERLKEIDKKYGYEPGRMARLPSSVRIEVLAIIARTLDNSSPKIGKMYKIIRERANDETSKVLELKEFEDVNLGSNSLLDWREEKKEGVNE